MPPRLCAQPADHKTLHQHVIHQSREEHGRDTRTQVNEGRLRGQCHRVVKPEVKSDRGECGEHRDPVDRGRVRNLGLPGGGSCSYEDRIRAVKLYIKLGKHTGATIRQLGYPTKNSLTSWPEEYERCLDLSRGYVILKPKYSLAQRLSGTISTTGAASPPPSRLWATRHGIRCVPGFTNCTPNCTRASLVDLAG